MQSPFGLRTRPGGVEQRIGDLKQELRQLLHRLPQDDPVRGPSRHRQADEARRGTEEPHPGGYRQKGVRTRSPRQGMGLHPFERRMGAGVPQRFLLEAQAYDCRIDFTERYDNGRAVIQFMDKEG